MNKDITFKGLLDSIRRKYKYSLHLGVQFYVNEGGIIDYHHNLSLGYNQNNHRFLSINAHKQNEIISAFYDLFKGYRVRLVSRGKYKRNEVEIMSGLGNAIDLIVDQIMCLRKEDRGLALISLSNLEKAIEQTKDIQNEMSGLSQEEWHTYIDQLKYKNQRVFFNQALELYAIEQEGDSLYRLRVKAVDEIMNKKQIYIYEALGESGEDRPVCMNILSIELLTLNAGRYGSLVHIHSNWHTRSSPYEMCFLIITECGYRFIVQASFYVNDELDVYFCENRWLVKSEGGGRYLEFV